MDIERNLMNLEGTNKHSRRGLQQRLQPGPGRLRRQRVRGELGRLRIEFRRQGRPEPLAEQGQGGNASRSSRGLAGIAATGRRSHDSLSSKGKGKAKGEGEKGGKGGFKGEWCKGEWSTGKGKGVNSFDWQANEGFGP